MDSQGVYHSRIFLNLFGKPVYSTIVAEKFQSYEVRITVKHICESKNSIWSFLLMSPSKTLPQAFIITPQSEGNYSFLPKSVFPRSFFLHNRKGGGVWIMELKKLLKINLCGHGSQVSISSTIFATFIFLVCFILP